MIFVSYCQDDEEWRQRFVTMAKPLEDIVGVQLWSDRNIKPGQSWQEDIRRAMEGATAAVLLVSDNFLASDFIKSEELPFFLEAAKREKVTILWVLLTPCLWKHTGLKSLQACCVSGLKPLIGMAEFEWKGALCHLCEEIDKVIRAAEKPLINRTLNGQKLERVQKNLQILERPAKRECEVLVYSGDGRWHVQGKVKVGSMTTNCWFGDEQTKTGAEFRIVVVTMKKLSLKSGTSRPDLPQFRTKSKEIMVKRV